MKNIHLNINPFQYNRFKTKKINIGSITLGGDTSIVIQSMANTPTLDTGASIEQCIKIIEAGADMVRFAAASVAEAKNLQAIKDGLRIIGYQTPLVADIHFNPQAAEVAARIVEKVRINPGNFIDKRATFQKLTYTDEEYQQEINKIRERLFPLFEICRKHNTALRIGTNHGSLSDRIMSRYGNTPQGMVEATIEFLRICRDEDFEDVAISMKASNTRVMIQATRLLVAQMQKEKINYPLHLGVTEAGVGEDGRIKSAVGIGTLLADGIGDTIRVSLTEAPEKEIPVAKNLANYLKKRENYQTIELEPNLFYNPFEYNRFETNKIDNIGEKQNPIVICDLTRRKILKVKDIIQAGYIFDRKPMKWKKSNIAADYIYTEAQNIASPLPPDLKVICPFKFWKNNKIKEILPLLNKDEFLKNPQIETIHFLKINRSELDEEIINCIKKNEKTVLVAESKHKNPVGDLRAFFYLLKKSDCKNPVIIHLTYNNCLPQNFQLFSSADTGALFSDGFGDGIWLKGNYVVPQITNATSFAILQASRVRTSKTEYISCPSCGRTLFDIEDAVKKVREKTSHLKGLKIAVMGCIVNGPGEMADADYGYVGSGKGKITLYKGKEVQKKNIPENEAIDQLIELIKENKDWKE